MVPKTYLSIIEMKFSIIISFISLAILCPNFPRPCFSNTPNTLEDALVIIQHLTENQTKLTKNLTRLTRNLARLTENQIKLDNEVKEIYQHILNNHDDIPITYKPEIIEWLRKQNRQIKHSNKSEPIIVETPCFRFIRFPEYWKLGNQFQGLHPGLVVKYNKNFTRAFVFPVSHARQYSDHVIPIQFPDDQKTSFILVDQFQNVCARNIGPARFGALTEDMWNEIYENYPFLKE